VRRLGLGLGSGLHVVGRLFTTPSHGAVIGSRVWVSASFQIFALTAEGECPRWGGKLFGIWSRGEMSMAKCPTLAYNAYAIIWPCSVGSFVIHPIFFLCLYHILTESGEFLLLPKNTRNFISWQMSLHYCVGIITQNFVRIAQGIFACQYCIAWRLCILIGSGMVRPVHYRFNLSFLICHKCPKSD